MMPKIRKESKLAPKSRAFHKFFSNPKALHNNLFNLKSAKR